MKKKVQFKGNSPVVIYDGETRIEVKPNDILELDVIPSGKFVIADDSLLKQVESEQLREKLLKSLVENGLSPKRVAKVTQRFISIDDLRENLDKLPFDESTNKFLCDNYEEKKKSKGGKK